MPPTPLADRLVLVVILALALAGTGCSEQATPIDQTPTDQTTTTTTQLTPHLLEPTDQMKELARQQCVDDPDLVQGEVNAVDPGRPDQKLATVTVTCDDVRAGTDPGP
jgi:PBP1b-binding outer membrane lipoprotein LpoB